VRGFVEEYRNKRDEYSRRFIATTYRALWNR
jgi:hypothetical protein